jgi:YbbR domain-containing protein
MSISTVSPTAIKVSAEMKLRKKIPVKAALKGRLPSGLTPSNVTCTPNSVSIEGPTSQISRITAVMTEEIDASQLKIGEEYQKDLHIPERQVTILRDSPVTVKLIALPRRKH